MTSFRLAGVDVPRVGLGTNRLTTAPAHVAFVRDAVAAGVRHIDTAHLYTGGESEREGIAFVPYHPLTGDGGPGVSAAAERLGVTVNAVKLAWLLQRSPVMLPIPGTRSIEHLRENLAALELDLGGADEIAA
jgi:aryl-alcohol dehydrogenase-like predicted oxidoreductase